MVADPEGATFLLWQAGTHAGAWGDDERPYRDVGGVDGAGYRSGGSLLIGDTGMDNG